MATDGRHEHEGVSRIPVAYLILGYENNRRALLDFYRNAGSIAYKVSGANSPEVIQNCDWMVSEISAARERGVTCKAIVDITSANLKHSKRLMTLFDDLRHLDGIGTTFWVSDYGAIAIVPSSAAKDPHNIQFIESESESVVSLKHLLFDALWLRATPAQSRIAELEGKVAGERSATTLERKDIIDRIYVCKNCHETFIYTSEVEDHGRTEGHENFHEYPLA